MPMGTTGLRLIDVRYRVLSAAASSETGIHRPVLLTTHVRYAGTSRPYWRRIAWRMQSEMERVAPRNGSGCSLIRPVLWLFS